MLKVSKFLVPFIVWVVILRDFIFGAIPFNMDTNTIYAVSKFYFNNLFLGQVPLWDPFVSLGHPFYALSICNLFNPITLLMPLLKICGLPYNVAFAFYIAIYFWVGCLGFYLLCKQLLKNAGLAYLAYVGLMFSSLGVSIFTQFTFVEIVVPAIWFFYFLSAFHERQRKGNFLGLTFSLMIAMSSYLPFYFLTVFCVFIVLVFVLWPFRAWHFCCQIAVFKINHWLLTLICLVGMIISAGPLLAYKMLDASGDAVSPGRHCQYSSVQECYDRTLNQQGGMLYEEIARSGGLGERIDVGYLFTHLDKMTYGSDSLFFIPFWCYVLFALSLLLRADRMNVLLIGMMGLIGLIGLGSAGPLHHFLFEHVFFMKYFRNLFFLAAFLIPLSILFAIKQLGALISFKNLGITLKKLAVIGVVGVHFLFAFYLWHLGGMIPSIWITLIASTILFIVYFCWGNSWPIQYWRWAFILIMLIEPLAVINAYANNAAEFRCDLPNAQVTPSFGWGRPDKPAVSTCRIYQFVPYEDFWYAMSMQDAPAIVGYPQAAARWTFMMSKQMGDQALGQYAKYKVYLFDDMNSPGRPLTQETGEIKVSHFDVNRVVFDVHLSKKQLLVYNDAYTQSWHVRVDGKPQELLRASGAFKGVWVEAGSHQIEFYDAPPGGQWVYLLTTITLFIFMAVLVVILKNDQFEI